MYTRTIIDLIIKKVPVRLRKCLKDGHHHTAMNNQSNIIACVDCFYYFTKCGTAACLKIGNAFALWNLTLAKRGDPCLIIRMISELMRVFSLKNEP